MLKAFIQSIAILLSRSFIPSFLCPEFYFLIILLNKMVLFSKDKHYIQQEIYFDYIWKQMELNLRPSESRIGKITVILSY
jgi:hypothetical protein